MTARHNARALAGALLSIGALLINASTAHRAEAQNWDGSGLVRFGVFLQGAFVDHDIRQTPAIGPAFSQSASPNGFGVGVSAGYDLRLGSFIAGAEADVAWDGGGDKTSPYTNEKYGTDYFATLRGRFGYIFHPGFMGYFTIGYGLLGAEYKREDLAGTGAPFKKNATLGGLVYGGGLEYELGWGTAFLEYLRTDLGGWDFRASVTNNRIDLDSSTDVIRFGLKFKVGHDHYHDVYRRSGRGDPLK
jgi:opacity protein-like surface antigen